MRTSLQPDMLRRVPQRRVFCRRPASDIKSQSHVARAAQTGLSVLSLASSMLIVWLVLMAPAAAQDSASVQVTLSLVRSSEVPANDTGRLSEILIREGQRVSKGDVLAVLENDQQALNVKAAELKLQVAELQSISQLGIESAEAQLQRSQSELQARQVALEIAVAEAESDVQIQLAKAEHKLQQLELERAENARSSFKGSISESQLDRLKTAVQKSQLEIQQASDSHQILQLKPVAERAAIQQSNQDIARFQTAVREAQQNLQIARLNHQLQSNELDVAKLHLERRNIRAPFDGVVAKIEKQTGEWVEPGTIVLKIIDLSTLRAEGFLAADQATPALVGRTVSILPGGQATQKPVPGEVTFVSSEIDPVNQQVRFWAEINNREYQLRPGVIATLKLTPRNGSEKKNSND